MIVVKLLRLVPPAAAAFDVIVRLEEREEEAGA